MEVKKAIRELVDELRAVEEGNWRAGAAKYMAENLSFRQFLDKTKDVSEFDTTGEEFVKKEKVITPEKVKAMVKKETKRRKK